MHLYVYDVFYSLYSPKCFAAAVAAIFRVVLLLQEYKGTNLVSCVVVTP